MFPETCSQLGSVFHRVSFCSPFQNVTKTLRLQNSSFTLPRARRVHDWRGWVAQRPGNFIIFYFHHFSVDFYTEKNCVCRCVQATKNSSPGKGCRCIEKEHYCCLVRPVQDADSSMFYEPTAFRKRQRWRALNYVELAYRQDAIGFTIQLS